MARAPEDRRIAILGRRWRRAGRARAAARSAPRRRRADHPLLIQAGEIQARHWIIDSTETFAVDRQVSDASHDDYDALLLGRHRELRPTPDPR